MEDQNQRDFTILQFFFSKNQNGLSLNNNMTKKFRLISKLGANLLYSQDQAIKT